MKSHSEMKICYVTASEMDIALVPKAALLQHLFHIKYVTYIAKKFVTKDGQKCARIHENLLPYIISVQVQNIKHGLAI